ncbi:MAG TPA: MgtC/SapB family protein [Kofleriaceae bacterium]|nr:MgtC/SapB family protein [Kofleriaceae bacterium]
MDRDLELILRIVIGTLLGAVIGYERDIHGRPAGLRTHAVVALAASTFMVVSTHFVYWQHYKPGDLVNVDTSRIAASVVSGIGFLAGGAILRSGLSVQGLTTAAGLWLVASIGLCTGGGMYVESVVVTALGIGVLTFLRRFEDKDDRVRRRLVLELGADAAKLDELAARLESDDITVDIEGWAKDAGDLRQVTLLVRVARKGGEQKLIALLEREPGIVRMELEAAS